MEIHGIVYRMDAPLHRLLWNELIISQTEIERLRTAYVLHTSAQRLALYNPSRNSPTPLHRTLYLLLLGI